MPSGSVCRVDWESMQAYPVRGICSISICKPWSMDVHSTAIGWLCRQHAPNRIQQKVQRLLHHKLASLHWHTIEQPEGLTHAGLLGWHMRTMESPLIDVDQWHFTPVSSLCLTSDCATGSLRH